MKSPLSYAEQQERKRKIISVGITFGLYCLTFAVGVMLSILNPQEQVFSNTTVLINLPGPITNTIGLGSINPSDVGDKALTTDPPAAAKSPEASTKEETPKAKVPEKQTEKAAIKSEPLPAPKTATAPAPKAAFVPAVSDETPSTAPTPGAPSTATPVETTPASPTAAEAVVAEPWVPGQRDPGSHISTTNSMLYVPGKGNVPWTGSTINIHKAEKGMSSDTTLGGAQGTVGHNIYVPVYWSLPLPKVVPASIYNAIPDLVQPPNTIIYSAQARKKAFGLYYEFDGSAYRLTKDVSLAQREPLWQILEDGGYNPGNADYKQGKNLSPVVIGFTVTNDNKLMGVEILQSSGDSDVDKSVLYGFKRAAFWNKTGETVPGRFTYRF